MAKGKWIDDLTAETPLQKAARHVLALRLEVVHKELVRTLDVPDEDPEYVHQLRVARAARWRRWISSPTASRPSSTARPGSSSGGFDGRG